MAVGLVLLAGFIALPVAIGAWILGFVPFGGAVLLYVGTGWAVLAAGMLSAMIGQILGRGPDEHDDATRIAVKAADRG
ncbi:hypothetical protein [Roseicyclus sp.]|uniref:hypothetical protein n=1 Tax=Roseicyclus sp. TaxID=1914329 RepID=UPI003F9FF779